MKQTNLTNAEIDRLLAICDKATPEPWWLDDNGDISAGDETSSAWVGQMNLNDEDQSFVFEARTALPAALRELREARTLARRAAIELLYIKEVSPEAHARKAFDLCATSEGEAIVKAAEAMFGPMRDWAENASSALLDGAEEKSNG